MTGNRVTEAMIELADKAFNDAVGKTELAPWPTMTERWTAALEAAFAAAQPSEDEVERVARAIWAAQDAGSWLYGREDEKELCRAEARAAIAALSPRPQAGMISADRACEIVETPFKNIAREWMYHEVIAKIVSTIRKEAGERPQAEVRSDDCYLTNLIAERDATIARLRADLDPFDAKLEIDDLRKQRDALYANNKKKQLNIQRLYKQIADLTSDYEASAANTLDLACKLTIAEDDAKELRVKLTQSGHEMADLRRTIDHFATLRAEFDQLVGVLEDRNADLAASRRDYAEAVETLKLTLTPLGLFCNASIPEVTLKFLPVLGKVSAIVAAADAKGGQG